MVVPLLQVLFFHSACSNSRSRGFPSSSIPSITQNEGCPQGEHSGVRNQCVPPLMVFYHPAGHAVTALGQSMLGCGDGHKAPRGQSLMEGKCSAGRAALQRADQCRRAVLQMPSAHPVQQSGCCLAPPKSVLGEGALRQGSSLLMP